MRRKDPVSPLPEEHIRGLIQKKASEANQKLGFEYYSDDPKAYVYVDTVNIRGSNLMIFLCPRSRSSLSVRIDDILNEEETS